MRNIVLIFLFALFGFGVVNSQPNVKFLQNYAQNIVNRMRPYLPVKSGRSFTLVAVSQNSGVLVYDHTLDIFFPMENKGMIVDWIIAQSYKSSCSVPDLANFVRNGGSLYYRFFYNNSVLASFKIERC